MKFHVLWFKISETLTYRMNFLKGNFSIFSYSMMVSSKKQSLKHFHRQVQFSLLVLFLKQLNIHIVISIWFDFFLLKWTIVDIEYVWPLRNVNFLLLCETICLHFKSFSALVATFTYVEWNLLFTLCCFF